MGDDQQFSVPVHHPNSLGSPSLDGSQPIQNQQPAQNNVFDYSLSCPPELHRLRDARELVLSSSMGNTMKIKDVTSQVVYTAKRTSDCNCGACCDPTASSTKFTVRDPNKEPVIIGERFQDSSGCCSVDQHIEVTYPSGVFVGQVKRLAERSYELTNTSGDVILTIEGESGCCTRPPFQVFSGEGRQVASIEITRRVKNKLVFMENLDIRSKVLLLIVAVSIQSDEDQSRKNRAASSGGAH
ncbi:phospholipid scramblase 1-like [Penaeus monodon]|uniref:phospholipid scramblase 1-like n=1 Tax=Penaeus monodon TaxID=6687 RepID=UPI0018A7A228|nr:phospholipid scramblase 1-like [Penaeus monodon]